ncbi:hypothetical protein [Shewanella atlantica]|uniref:Uncharacterized protein n=1 Tax=Shewanella atlantica TaxID=271099 RepID=A0A431VS47_9GAMM|nr:hypothetical protein [Shewanella atlantica]RTR26068.1 hypothetical protein EKG39_22370 [Shewanella atlantica]
MIRKKLIFILLLCSTALSAAPIAPMKEGSGRVGIDYYPTYVSETKHLSTIGYKNNNSWRDIIIDSPSKGKPIHDEVKEILSTINNKLFNVVETEAREGINDTPTLRFRELKRARLVGPLKTKIITQNNGVVTVEVSGFTFDAEVKVDWLGFTLYGDVDTSTLRFSADYELNTARVYNLRDIGNLQVDIDIDGNGIINSIVAETVEVLADIFVPDFVQDSVDDALNELNDNEYYVKAFDNVILPQTWIIDGIDIGLEIKDAIKGINPGKYISISLYEWDERYYEGSMYRYYYRNRAEVDISNSYKFDYSNEPVYTVGDWENPCAGAGGAGSGCYEP